MGESKLTPIQLEPKGDSTGSLSYRIMTPKEDGLWEKFISYETKQEAIDYLEKVNVKLRPATIVFAQRVLRAYDYGIIDYEYINQIEEENQELRVCSKCNNKSKTEFGEKC